MDIDDLIYVVQNQLEKDFCKHVIEKFKNDNDKYQGLIGRIGFECETINGFNYK